MPTLRSIKRRIGSVQSTQKITKAMKMVAAAKLRRAQEKILATRPYARKLDQILKHISSLAGKSILEEHPLLAKREENKICLVVVTADRGLCGSFNSNIIKKTLDRIEHYKGKEISLICVGGRGRDYFIRHGYKVIWEYVHFFNWLKLHDALTIGEKIIGLYTEKKFDKVEVIYNEFKSIIQQKLVAEQLLPIIPEKPEQKYFQDYIYEPSQAELLNVLLPKQINIQIWRILLESNSAEQGARMAAMENATENAKELISLLKLQYNKARQSAITKEILEVSSGAEALKAAS
jgi:F-type H+-transporting ATPase subunit gamma